MGTYSRRGENFFSKLFQEHKRIHSSGIISAPENPRVLAQHLKAFLKEPLLTSRVMAVRKLIPIDVLLVPAPDGEALHVLPRQSRPSCEYPTVRGWLCHLWSCS